MEPENKAKLIANWGDICENLTGAKSIAGLLYGDVLTQFERDEVLLDGLIPTQRNMKLLEHLERKRNVFDKIVKAFWQTGNGVIAERLQPGSGAKYKQLVLSASQLAPAASLSATTQATVGGGQQETPNDSSKDETPDLDICYPMSKPKLGRCLIINNRRFKNKKLNRNGADHDVDELLKLFEGLHFEVTPEINLSGEQIKDIIDEYSDSAKHREYGCFVCVIMSHGTDGAILGVDEEKVQIEEDIIMKIQSCEALREKPKIFIFQACRGERTDRGMPARADSVQETQEEAHEDVKLKLVPTLSDVLVAYPTVKGYAAFRRESNLFGKGGSWFIQSLVDVIRIYHKKYHLVDMLTEVNRRVSKEVGVLEDGERVCAVSNFISTLTKRVYFNDHQ